MFFVHHTVGGGEDYGARDDRPGTGLGGAAFAVDEEGEVGAQQADR
jgi:hypothetical protein